MYCGTVYGYGGKNKTVNKEIYEPFENQATKIDVYIENYNKYVYHLKGGVIYQAYFKWNKDSELVLSDRMVNIFPKRELYYRWLDKDILAFSFEAKKDKSKFLLSLIKNGSLPFIINCKEYI